ncbi:MAG: hypothetical protein ACLR7U_06035 [Ruthenibacterium lactatiformans]
MADHTPGKRWDSFYTWDSGFIGLGLAQADAELGRRVLEQYLSGPENSDFAFVHHGSLVPVQFYLYQDLLARAQDKAGLLRLYPAMRRYYEFLAGRGEGSTTARFASGLLTNYDYFYNASGMDDYAAQVLMHARRAFRAARTRPVHRPCHPRGEDPAPERAAPGARAGRGALRAGHRAAFHRAAVRLGRGMRLLQLCAAR